jgi:hypothetical protein
MKLGSAPIVRRRRCSSSDWAIDGALGSRKIKESLTEANEANEGEPDVLAAGELEPLPDLMA